MFIKSIIHKINDNEAKENIYNTCKKINKFVYFLSNTESLTEEYKQI